jgi:hypothetical protein
VNITFNQFYSDDINFNDGTLNGNLYIKVWQFVFTDLELQELVDLRRKVLKGQEILLEMILI